MTCSVSLYSECFTINCELVRTIYLSNKIDEEIDTKTNNHSTNNANKCRSNDILQKFGMPKIIYEIIYRETLVQKRWYQLNTISVHTKHFEIAT